MCMCSFFMGQAQDVQLTYEERHSSRLTAASHLLEAEQLHVKDESGIARDHLDFETTVSFRQHIDIYTSSFPAACDCTGDRRSPQTQPRAPLCSNSCIRLLEDTCPPEADGLKDLL